jgi:ubiquinone/menaquinone biosynthesis C-methylase UbiE
MHRLLVTLVLVAAALPAQLAKKANEGYQTAEDRARVARGLDSDDREQKQKPRELLAGIGVAKGQTIADIGSGPGFMEPYFLEAVGPSGKVYAEDIQQDFLDQVKAKIKENGWKNVETILGGQTDPKLPKGQIDLAFILDAYHHFEEPQKTLAHILESLAPGGRLAVIDFYRSRKHPTMSKERLEGHIREDRDGFAAEIEKAGFKLIRRFDHLPHQYVLLFEAAE